MEAVLTVSDRMDDFSALPIQKDAARSWEVPATGGVGLFFDFGDEEPRSSNAGGRLFDGYMTASARVKVPFGIGQGHALGYAEQIASLFRGQTLTRDGATGSLECRKVRLELTGRDQGFFVADVHITFHRTVYH
jgi:hypothetical protein